MLCGIRRRDRVVVEIPWKSRDKLLNEIGGLDSTRDICRAFEAVGSRRAVELNVDQTVVLVTAIDAWTELVGRDNLPAGIFELRNALLDDLLELADRQ
jgi:hypothetical protein